MQRTLTPAFAAGLERSGKPVRQHALVRRFIYTENHAHELLTLKDFLMRFYLQDRQLRYHFSFEVEISVALYQYQRAFHFSYLKLSWVHQQRNSGDKYLFFQLVKWISRRFYKTLVNELSI